jgi:2-keto-4-pentenoate hydratase/2-oxohepta-3-ene-1,7-dioic acid hydratase in catechol pathway
VAWIEGPEGRLRAGKVLCLVRNYQAHAEEFHQEAPPEPVYFLKPSTALLPSGGTVLLPPAIGEVQAEAELAVVLGRRARGIRPEEALDRVLGYAAFLDITARDLQRAAVRKGLPWTLAKGMDSFAPLGPVRRREAVEDPHGLRLRLRVNGQVRQEASTERMIHRIPPTLAHMARYMTLERGDVVATGTPAGVPTVAPGDVLELEVEKVGALRVRVEAGR